MVLATVIAQDATPVFTTALSQAAPPVIVGGFAFPRRGRKGRRFAAPVIPAAAEKADASDKADASEDTESVTLSDLRAQRLRAEGNHQYASGLTGAIFDNDFFFGDPSLRPVYNAANRAKGNRLIAEAFRLEMDQFRRQHRGKEWTREDELTYKQMEQDFLSYGYEDNYQTAEFLPGSQNVEVFKSLQHQNQEKASEKSAKLGLKLARIAYQKDPSRENRKALRLAQLTVENTGDFVDGRIKDSAIDAWAPMLGQNVNGAAEVLTRVTSSRDYYDGSSKAHTVAKAELRDAQLAYRANPSKKTWQDLQIAKAEEIAAGHDVDAYRANAYTALPFGPVLQYSAQLIADQNWAEEQKHLARAEDISLRKKQQEAIKAINNPAQASIYARLLANGYYGVPQF